MSYKFSKKSLDNLSMADERLQLLFKEVIKEKNISIICGYRGKEEQEKAYKDGKSRAHFGQSPHNFNPSYAIDVCPYPIDWYNLNRFADLAYVVKLKARELGIEVLWGGDWSSLKDYPHWEIKSWQTERIKKEEEIEEQKETLEKKSIMCIIFSWLKGLFKQS